MAGKGNPKGVGRKPGVPNKATADIKALAQQYGAKAMATLAQIMESGEGEAARIAAAKELLDRGYGKAAQAVDVTTKGESVNAALSDTDAARVAAKAAALKDAI